MRHKYHAKPQRTEDGYFASKKELKRWNELKILQADGQISDLSRSRKDCTFTLHCLDGSKVCNYIADYVYLECGRKIAEDAKGKRLNIYKLKRKLFIAEYGHAWEHRES